MINDYNKTFEARPVEIQARRSDIELAGSTAAAHRAAIETLATTSLNDKTTISDQKIAAEDQRS